MPGRAELCSQAPAAAHRRLLEDGVALLERPLIATPHAEEFVFHVKHTPVEQSAATGGSFLDQAMHAGVDDLDRRISAISAIPEMPWPARFARVPCPLYSMPATSAARGLDAPDDAQEVGLRQSALIRPERATVREEVDRLEQARSYPSRSLRRFPLPADRAPGEQRGCSGNSRYRSWSAHRTGGSIRAASA